MDIGVIQSSPGADIGPIQTIGGGTTTTTQTITGQSDILVVTTKTITGQASIIFPPTTKTITGQSCITATTDRTITGQACVKNTTTKTITGQADLRHAKTITGQACIFNTTAKTIIGQAYIFVPRHVSPDIGPIQSISFPNGQDIGPIQSLPVFQTLKIITGQAMLIGNSVQTITGQAYIVGQQYTITGQADIKKLSIHKTVTGQAVVKRVGVGHTITGQSYLNPVGTVQTRQSITGQADIENTTLRTIRGVAAIKNTTTKTITGQGDIAGADVTPPTQVVGLTVFGMTFTWLPSSDAFGVTGYIIQRCSGGGCTSYTTIATVSGSTLTWTQPTGLPPGHYCYRVIATDAAGNLATPSAAVCIDINPGTSEYTIKGQAVVLSATPTAGVLVSQNPLEVLRSGADIKISQFLAQVLTRANDAGIVVSQVNLRVAIPYTAPISRSWPHGGSHGHLK